MFTWKIAYRAPTSAITASGAAGNCTAAIAGLGYQATLADASSAEACCDASNRTPAAEQPSPTPASASEDALHIAIIGTGGGAMAAANTAAERVGRVTVITRKSGG